MVGEQITKLNPLRAYCVALSAAITVIIASWLGLKTISSVLQATTRAKSEMRASSSLPLNGAKV